MKDVTQCPTCQRGFPAVDGAGMFQQVVAGCGLLPQAQFRPNYIA